GGPGGPGGEVVWRRVGFWGVGRGGVGGGGCFLGFCFFLKKKKKQKKTKICLFLKIFIFNNFI
ncbi:hypothetical protein, partial [Escherichia coli]|uniref:hypothetical protein n=1 Tax=Escherichia coli TaxID=562 RepID=UPI002FBE26DD